MKVKIPFKARFKEPMLSGRKTWTSRTKCYGRSGDIFEAFGHEFIIEKIETKMLLEVARHWLEEGCKSKLDFIELWKKIHPRKGFDSYQWVHVHIFRRMTKI